MTAPVLDPQDYQGFLDLMRTDEGARVKLDNRAALALGRSGFARSPRITMWIIVTWIALLSVVVVPFIGGGWMNVAISLGGAIVGINMTKAATVRVVWRELGGKGKLPYETREELYAALVSCGGLRIKA